MYKIIYLFLVTASFCSAQIEIYFSPPETGASVSFEGVTQAGKDIHRFEVRKLAYKAPQSPHSMVTALSCVIYYAGTEYGPEILLQMEAIAPLVRFSSRDTIEVFFSRGVSEHYRQEWKLLGHTAKLLKEEEIGWKDDPRIQKTP